MPNKKKQTQNLIITVFISIMLLILIIFFLWQKDMAFSPKQNELGLTALSSRNLNAEDFNRYKQSVETLKIMPEEKAAALNLGYIYRQQGLYEDAEKAFGFQLYFDELDAEALMGMARVYVDQGKYEEAEEAYYKIIDVYPLYMIAYRELLVLYQDGSLPKNPKFIEEANYSLQFEDSENYQAELRQLLLEYNLIP